MVRACVRVSRTIPPKELFGSLPHEEGVSCCDSIVKLQTLRQIKTRTLSRLYEYYCCRGGFREDKKKAPNGNGLPL